MAGTWQGLRTTLIRQSEPGSIRRYNPCCDLELTARTPRPHLDCFPNLPNTWSRLTRSLISEGATRLTRNEAPKQVFHVTTYESTSYFIPRPPLQSNAAIWRTRGGDTQSQVNGQARCQEFASLDRRASSLGCRRTAAHKASRLTILYYAL